MQAQMPAGISLQFLQGVKWPIAFYDNIFPLPGVPDQTERKMGDFRDWFKTFLDRGSSLRRPRVSHSRIIYLSKQENAVSHVIDAISEKNASAEIASYVKTQNDPSKQEWHVRIVIEVLCALAFVASLGTRRSVALLLAWFVSEVHGYCDIYMGGGGRGALRFFEKKSRVNSRTH